MTGGETGGLLGDRRFAYDAAPESENNAGILPRGKRGPDKGELK